MEGLIKRFFKRLPENLLKSQEAYVLWNILRQGKDISYREFAYGLEEWETNGDILHNWTDLLETEIDEQKRDFRVRKYLLKHFRKFNEKEGKPFALNMIDDKNRVCSLFLAGKNGTGKTSLFTGLEYMLSNTHISTLEYRNIADRERYFPYGNCNQKDIRIILEINEDEIVEGEQKFRRLFEPINSNFSFRPFFCCDVELAKIQKENDLSEVFIRDLNLTRVRDLITQLEGTIKYFRDKIDFNIEKPNYNTALSEILQDDILQIAGLTKWSYENLLKKMKDMKDSIERDKYKETVKGQTVDLVANIKYNVGHFVGIWSVTPYTNNGSLRFFENNKVLEQNYKKVGEMIETLPIDALLLYQSLKPVEVFAKECIEYITIILDTFKSHDKTERRKSAITALERLIKTEREAKVNLLKYHEIESISINSIHINNLEDIYRKFKEIYNDELDDVYETCKQIIVPILNEFTNLDGMYEGFGGENFNKKEEIYLEKENGKIEVKIKNIEIFGERTVSPKMFYNSFRYKLYAISIKVAMAFMTMKIWNVNAPLVFDDVFTASDFDNSVNIDRFFRRIYETYEKLEIGKKNELQILLFSHDEVVLNCVASVIKDLGNSDDIGFIKGIILKEDMINEHDGIYVGKELESYSLYEKCY